MDSASLFRHTRPARGDLMLRFSKALFKSFNPRAPRGAHSRARPGDGDICFVTRPARGAFGSLRRSSRENVSIHAPRAGPRQGRRSWSSRSLFQSTRPARDAFPSGISPPSESTDRFNPRAPRGAAFIPFHWPMERSACFSPRAPRGARQGGQASAGVGDVVSIHAPRAGRLSRPPYRPIDGMFPSTPRAGRDSRIFTPVDGVWRFQSTRPARDATSRRRKTRGLQRGFNPRAPRGQAPRRPP